MSNKQRFEYFSRTIPSDHYQTLAMTKIVLRLGWKYISIVYEESNYGIKVGKEEERLLYVTQNPVKRLCLRFLGCVSSTPPRPKITQSRKSLFAGLCRWGVNLLSVRNCVNPRNPGRGFLSLPAQGGSALPTEIG